MFKVIMRDNLGWMKDAILITGSIVELNNFIVKYNGSTDSETLDNLSRISDLEQLVINTKDGLKLSIMAK